ncbi:DUF1980 domain-containing protein [Rubritalea marina]|uniref:TIGR03943 family putative permease subunit n=1 Tax=Rubritalea marina TaxID=361055 RepID=UPI00036E5432|nr:DUF1980 domain-containing protein [Rubritalea marina]
MLVLQRAVYAMCTIVLGGFLLYFYQADFLIAYVKESFHLAILLGGLVATVLGVFNLVCCRQGGNEDGCGHNHEEAGVSPFSALFFIVVPLVLCLIFTKHEVAASHLEKQADIDADPSKMKFLVDLPPFTKETLEQTRQKSVDGYFEMNLLELFYSAGDPELERVFSGLDFETSGQIKAETKHQGDGKRMRLFRMFMTCCAADMKAVPMGLEFSGELPQFEAGAWVEVAGSLSYEMVGGLKRPLLHVDRIEQIEAPSLEERYQ